MIRECGCGKHFEETDDNYPRGGYFWSSECDEVTCTSCGKNNGYNVSCKCWKKTSDINLADLKAVFAASDLSLN